MDFTSSESKDANARDFMEWVEAYQKAGFSREEAFAILMRPVVQIASALPPDMNEWISKMNLLADDAISDR